MTLDLILFRPEFFLIFGFFVLLWLGTGNLVTPVAEILTVTKLNMHHRVGHSIGQVRMNRTIKNGSVFNTQQTRGPNHASSALT